MECAAKQVVATTMFTEVRQFSKIANILSLEETHAFLNDYYTLIVECVSARGGSINKFMGDGVLAVFGAPDAHADDPKRAVQSAIAIQRMLDTINITWRRSLDFLVEIHIGMSTGTILAGTVGHVKKLEYTVLGKYVNLAARLVHLCKDFNVEILLDSTTFEGAKDVTDFKDIGEKNILGFPEPVKLYTIAAM